MFGSLVFYGLQGETIALQGELTFDTPGPSYGGVTYGTSGPAGIPV